MAEPNITSGTPEGVALSLFYYMKTIEDLATVDDYLKLYARCLKVVQSPSAPI